MARRNRHKDPTQGLSREESLCRRAARFSRRGDSRQAMLLLKAAAHENTDDAKLWVLFGVQCGRIGKTADALKALNHAVWLRERAGEPGKARTTRQLIARYDDDSDRAA